MTDKLFAPANRAKIMAARANKPSGVIVEIGGLSFNLVALNAGEVLSVLDLLTELAGIAEAASAQTLTGPQIMLVIGKRGREVAALVRSVLKRSAGVDTAEEESVFNEWFDAQPIVEMGTTVIPKILEANGLGEMMSRPQVAEPETTPVSP